MLILLPPSESKSSAIEGPSLSFQSLWLADPLTPARQEVCKSLISLAKGPKKLAVSTLGLTPGLADELIRDAKLMSASCAPAIDVYTGVLYEALGWQSLSVNAKRRGESQLRIVSALFGILRPLDLIPAYRLGMDVNLPKVGGLATFWKRHLEILEEQDVDVVIDLRSQTYAKVWRPVRAKTAMVRVFVEKSGKRSVVSHMAKKTRGEVARALLNLTKEPTSIEAVARALNKTFDIELGQPIASGKPYFIDVILRD